jgi:hypothetical protein
VLSEKETGHDLSAFKAYIANESAYAPSLRGKNNLYKLFVCRAVDLLCDGGRLGFITPMAILGDDQASEIRKMILKAGAFTSIDAFPQKDDPTKRIFPEAKLSTAVFTLTKSSDRAIRAGAFTARTHPAQFIVDNGDALTLTSADIPLYDPTNVTVVSCSQADWDLATRIIKSGRMARLRDFVEFFQGEVNETNERAKGNLTDKKGGGRLVTRGAAVCLYVLRPASQGDDLYLNVAKFLDGKGLDTKAFHHRYRRIGWQESCPQNNFRRVITAMIPGGEFCNHKINYLPEHTAKVPLEFALGLLNGKLSDWYFRLGSTNAAVSHYQVYNLPCPVFGEETAADRKMRDEAIRARRAGDLEKCFGVVKGGLGRPPFSIAVRDLIVELVTRITQIEATRGEIARTERSRLDPAAQPYQDLIDRLLYAMAGLTDCEAKGLEERLERML